MITYYVTKLESSQLHLEPAMRACIKDHRLVVGIEHIGR